MRQLLLLTLGLLLPLAALAQEKVPDDAYAVVGSTVITKQQVQSETGQGLPAAAALRRVVQLEVLRFNLRREGHDPAALPAEELQAGIADAAREFEARGMKLEDALARSGRTREQFEAAMRVSVSFSQFVKGRVSDERAAEGFEQRALRVAGEVRASHILVAVNEKQNAEAARAKASALVEKLEAAKDLPAEFAKVAREESADPMASVTYGDLDWFDLRGRGLNQPPRAVIQAAFSLGKPGLVSEPAQSRAGIHVVLVTAVHLPKDATRERLLPQLRAEAEAQEATALLGKWMRSTPVRYAKDAPRLPDRPR